MLSVLSTDNDNDNGAGAPRCSLTASMTARVSRP